MTLYKKDHYDSAAVRHYRDGELLLAKKRSDNADHLFGLAAECAIKFALSSLPGCSGRSGLGKYYQKHVDELWDRAQLQSLHRRFPSLLAFLKAGPRFDDWSVSQRYGPDEAVSEEVVGRHREAAKRLLGCVRLTGTSRDRRK